MSTPEPLREIGQVAEGAVELYTIRWSDSTDGIRVSGSKFENWTLSVKNARCLLENRNARPDSQR